MDVGFLGMGAMGRPMAANLVRAGHRVVAWNRTRAEPPEGVELLNTPADVAAKACTTIVMVTDAAAVRAVLFGLGGWVEGASVGDVLVQSSTISPIEIRAIAAELIGHGIRVVDAPVSGSVAPAEQGALTVLAGGDNELIDSLTAVLRPLAKTVTRCGPVGAGSAVKLAANATLVSVLAAAGEALTWLADTEPEVSLDAMTAVMERISPLVARRVGALVGQPPTGQYRLRHVAKDLGLVIDAMSPTVVLWAVANAAHAAVEQGLADFDISAFGMAARARRKQGK